MRVGSDFSGVGAFNQALIKLGIEYDEVFVCDIDKYARETFVLNYGEPKYFPKDVYERDIPSESLDIYMSSPACQTFSISGKRSGENDKRGILFYNTHEFIKINNPRYFIIENVKGLLSSNGGKIFNNWLELLGGKSINGKTILFPNENSVPYHIHYEVLNSKHYGVPQNRERVFIVGIRDDSDNNFRFPPKIKLEKRLLDVLEQDVDDKYFLSQKMLDGFYQHKDRHQEKGNGFGFKPKTEKDIANSISCKSGNRQSDNFIIELKQVGSLYEDNNDAGRVYDPNGISCTLKSEGGGLGAKTGLYDVSILGYTRDKNGKVTSRHENEIANTIHSSTGGGGNTDQYVLIKSANNTIETNMQQCVFKDKAVRRLTPTECFRLMGFPDTFKFNCSPTQAYKQAGNSIVVDVLAAIIKNLNLK